MISQPVYRKILPGEEQADVSLLESVFGGWPRFDLKCAPIDHWRWKYVDNPLKKSSVVVSLVDGKMVGCSHGIYSKVRVGGKSLIAHQGVDVAVNGEYRGMGIMRGMLDLKDKHQKEMKANLSYILSNNPIVIKRDLELGLQQFPKPLRHYLKIKDLDLHMRMKKTEGAIIKKIGYKTLEAGKQVEGILKLPSIKSKSRIEVKQVDRFGDDIDEFWARVESGYGFIGERDKSHLNWRYCDPRGGGYVVRLALENGGIVGYIVLRVNRFNKEYPEGYIVDLLSLPRRLDVEGALVEDAVDYFNEQRVNVVNALAIRGHSCERLFERNGFLWDREKYTLFCTPWSVGDEWETFRSSSAGKLHFMYGDLDWI
jgi:hypothetical protein